MVLGLSQGYPIDDGIQPTISRPAEPMPGDTSGRCLDGRHSGISCQLGVIAESLPWPQDPGQRTGSKQVDPAQSGQRKGMLGRQFLDPLGQFRGPS